jgi:hypothetical protein
MHHLSQELFELRILFEKLNKLEIVFVIEKISFLPYNRPTPSPPKIQTGANRII